MSTDGAGQVDPGAQEPLGAEFAAWSFWQTATAEQRADQLDRLAELRSRGFTIGDGCTVSRLAAVHPDSFELGDRSYVAAHAHVSGEVSMGADSSVNAFATVRGRVTIGRAVRIGAHTSVLGFDHGFAGTDQEIFRQPLTSAGVRIGDDVWIGSHALVLDGVRIGSHTVVGAGSVLTKDVPAWAVVVGNPARVVRDRRGRRPHEPGGGLAGRLSAFADQARHELPGILAASWQDGAYRDTSSAAPTVRAHGDAIELAALLSGGPPPQLRREEHIERLRAAQDPTSGLVAELVDGRWPAGLPPEPGAEPGPEPGLPDQARAYHVLSVGCALDLLGSELAHPVRAVTALEPGRLVRLLDALPWTTEPWGSGALVDAVGTALTWARRSGYEHSEGLAEAVVGWLVVHQDPQTGLWGSSPGGLREPVNGTYRLVRGTFAQWGVWLGGQERLIGSVLTRAEAVVGRVDVTACDALDVVHLLRWARDPGREHRRCEIEDVARSVLDTAVSGWVPGRGIRFDPRREPSLQGTEMWLAVAWYAADLLGVADALGYRPTGVHRPEPAAAASSSCRRPVRPRGGKI
ncbi:DapH/DapD/GlmU-related protein [Cellulomonas sp. KRMCY2]|uniref:acyltransferase n=1 Tax=Cellulomonas sp. KRMCY2 TaxID=1304865 RepID=UPI00045E828A|nr:acyltransferase [Cellulomonas sp. KRMCY2]